MQVAAVILAAGASTRFGSPKQLARIGGTTMLEAVAEIARNAGLAPIIAVVPPDLTVPPGVLAVPNDRPGDGLSRSLRLGFDEVPDEADAAVILLGDQPTLSVSTVRAVVDGVRDRAVVAAEAGARLGPPVLVMRRAFAEVDAARGDEGLRRLLAERPELVTRVTVESHPPDVDTPADLRALDARIAHMFDSSGDR
jgi:molybdenum cofactor cytidylyltransferase